MRLVVDFPIVFLHIQHQLDSTDYSQQLPSFCRQLNFPADLHQVLLLHPELSYRIFPENRLLIVNILFC